MVSLFSNYHLMAADALQWVETELRLLRRTAGLARHLQRCLKERVRSKESYGSLQSRGSEDSCSGS